MTDSTVEFSLLCTTFDAVARAKKGPLKRKHIRTFLDRIYTGHEFYSVVRLMLPGPDRVRGNYGLKETVLGRFLTEALCLAKDSADAQKLLNWRKGGTRAGSNAGNFAFIATEILFRRQRLTSTDLKIRDVNDILDRLAAAEHREGKVSILAEMISKTNAHEMRWIIMIILKDLKLGISEATIFSEFHPDAQDLFNVTSDLKLVCETLKNRSERYNRQDIQVGKAVRPQMAKRVANVEEAWKKLRGKEVTVECKFDGERIQIHKDGTRLHLYSRTFNDHHEKYKKAVADLLIQNVLPEKCILDGELLVWDRVNNCFAEFGTNQEVAKAAREGLETSEQMCYVAFDILYCGDTSVIHLPLRQRRELLCKAVRTVKGRLEILNPSSGLATQPSFGEQRWSFIAKSAEEVKHFFRKCVENREEGIVLKDLDSKWDPNDRTGKWLKLKPDYIKSGSDLDVLIIGGYFGSGRRGGQVAQFLLGIAEKPKADEYPTMFYSFCKVGSGLTDEECEVLVQKLSPYFRRNEKNSRPPSCYTVTNHSKERPDVWVEQPDKSVLLEVASDIRTIDTTVFAAPYGLRFPRVSRVRYEKPWYDCLDVQTLVSMVNSGTGGTMDVEGHGNKKNQAKESKKRVKKAKRELLPLVPSHMWNTDVSHVTHTTKIFSGLTFYFVNNPVEHSKESLHKMVVENGGSFSMNLSITVTHAVASERKGIKFQASAAHGDVIHYSWILDCCNAKSLLPVSPKYFLHLSNQTKDKKKDEIDVYGDQYFANIDDADLSQIFKNIDMAELATNDDGLARDKRKYCSSLTLSQFSNCNIYFHKPIHSSNPDSQAVAEIALKRQKLEVSMHEGAVSETMNPDLTHMIVYTSSEKALPFRTIVKSVSSQDRCLLASDELKILSHQWIDDHLNHDGVKEADYDLRDNTFRFNTETPKPVDKNEDGSVKKLQSSTTFLAKLCV